MGTHAPVTQAKLAMAQTYNLEIHHAEQGGAQSSAPFILEEKQLTTTAVTAKTAEITAVTAENVNEELQRLYPGLFLPNYRQALELAAVYLERQHGPAAAEDLWHMSASPNKSHLIREDYHQAIADHLAHWGARINTPIAERMANYFADRELAPKESDPPPGWDWPVCDDCTMMAYDMGQQGAAAQARFMQELGAELPGHLCEMALDPEDRSRNSCACGCRNGI